MSGVGREELPDERRIALAATACSVDVGPGNLAHIAAHRPQRTRGREFQQLRPAASGDQVRDVADGEPRVARTDGCPIQDFGERDRCGRSPEFIERHRTHPQPQESSGAYMSRLVVRWNR